ncbi:uncharacterized protein PV06_03411 [Exophiala oligosperma]|uniref:Uncharacterized protein n=1 Tax=Exophiala oligosperma TaxID=215243 RepID=A0A0D2EAL7_9EURO|nr:uncharacterized protein PV06_03411 [Exophiala oligosperma]KIW44984.1 hypothetical protein PV06_03411 [Exophiala oligosperma]
MSCTFPLRQKPRLRSHSSPDTPKRKTRRLQTSHSVGEDVLPGHENNGDGCDRLTATLFQVLDSNATSDESQDHYAREPTLNNNPTSSFEEATRLRADGLGNGHVQDSSSSQGEDASFELPDLRLLINSENEDPTDVRPSTLDFGSGMNDQSSAVSGRDGWGIPNEVAVDL